MTGMTLSRGSALRPRTAPQALTPAVGALTDEAYQVILATQAAALEAAVQGYIDAHPSLDEAERDGRIRAELVRPHVLSYNRAAPFDRRVPEERAVRDLFNRLRGSHGSLAALIEDASGQGITDIHVNGPDQNVQIERRGVLEELRLKLTAEEIDGFLARALADTGGHPLSPRHWSLRLNWNGLRVSATHEYVQPGKGRSFSIRIPSAAAYDLADLVALGMFPDPVRQLLEILFVEAGLNTLIGGPMGAGKTTVAQALLRALDPERSGWPPVRVGAIEAPIGLRLGPFAQQFECHPPAPGEPDRKGEVTARDLFPHLLTRKFHRIVVGEVRGPEAFDMLKAMSGGANGSVTTIHGNTADELVKKLEVYCLEAPEKLRLEEVQRYIVGVIDLILVTRRTARGLHLVALCGIDRLQGNEVVLNDILVWEDGELRQTGYTFTSKRVAALFAARGRSPDDVRRLLTALPLSKGMPYAAR